MSSNTVFIRNVSYSAIEKGDHPNFGDNTILIQIVDPDMDFPVPKLNFNQVRQYKFADIEDVNDKTGISDEQAKSIVDDLTYAKENGMNVMVHCVAGLCRSGAVCEVGVMMGFQDTFATRMPNLLVKTKLMRVLGWTYDS